MFSTARSCRLSLLKSVLTVLALLLLANCTPPPPPTGTPTPTPGPGPTPFPTPRPKSALTSIGINGINLAENDEHSSARANDAHALGASWDIWTANWYFVEQPWRQDSPWGEGQFNWQGQFTNPRDPSEPTKVPDTTRFNVEGAATGYYSGCQ